MVLMTASPLYRSGSNLSTKVETSTEKKLRIKITSLISFSQYSPISSSGLSGVIDPKYGMVEVIYIFNPILKYGKKNQEHQEDR